MWVPAATRPWIVQSSHTLSGEAEEGERLVRKAMRLNPYHPENFWFHLARALFHRGEGAEALSALRRITRPKLR